MRRPSRVLRGHLVEKVEQHSAYYEADLVVSENVEEGDDLVDVLLGGMFSNGLCDRPVGEKSLPYEWLLGELEAIDPRARAVKRAQCDAGGAHAHNDDCC